MKHRIPTLLMPAAAAALGLAATTPLVDFDWNVAGPANFFAPGNWTTGTVPGASDTAYIRNGGTAVADGKLTGNPTSLTVHRLEVGTEAGAGAFHANDVDLFVGPAGSYQELAIGDSAMINSGTVDDVDGQVTITDAASLRIDGDLDVSELWADGTGSVSGSGSCTIEFVEDVFVGGDLDVGAHHIHDYDNLVDGASVSGHGDLVLRDIQFLTVDGDGDIADGDINLENSGPGGATAHHSATALFERIFSCHIENDLDIGGVTANANETEIVDADVTFRDVNLLSLGSEINWLRDGAHGTGAAAGVLDYEGTLTFERVICSIASDVHLNYTVNMSGDGDVHAIGTWNLIDSVVALDEGEPARIGAIDFAQGDPTGELGGGAPGNSVEAYVNMTRSELTASSIKLGRRLNGVPGILEADIDMVGGSYISTEMVEVGTEGLFDLHIGGLTRVTPSLVGTPGTYSAIDADDALLGGEFKVTFDFIPPSGTHTFDLLVTASNTALDDTTATFSVNDMPPGFMVDSFGVVEEGGVDVVRLVVKGCTPVFSSETVRLGTPANPSVFLPGVSSGPVAGQTWDPVVSHASFLPTATLDIAAIAAGSANVPLSPYGTLLIDVFTSPPIQFSTPAGVPFAIPIPSDCDFVGLALYSQGLSTDGATFSFTNALDITIGSI